MWDFCDFFLHRTLENYNIFEQFDLKTLIFGIKYISFIEFYNKKERKNCLMVLK